MPDSSNERAIGRLEGKLDALIESVDRNTRESKESRAKVYEQLEALRSTSSEMKTHITAVDQRLQKVEPIAQDLSKWRERGVGVLMFVSLVAASVGGAVAAFWQKLIALFAGG